MTDTQSTRRVTNGEFVSLKEYFEMKFSAMDRALTLVQETNDARLERMNEFRSAMQDQSSHFVTRPEADAARIQSVAEIKIDIAGICADIEILKKFQATMEGKASQSSVIWAYIVGGIGVILSLWDFIRSVQ